MSLPTCLNVNFDIEALYLKEQKMKPIPNHILRYTYAREHPYRINWPSEYEKGMADPIIRVIVETLARHVPAYARGNSTRHQFDWKKWQANDVDD